MFSVCSRYKECSLEGFCINTDEELKNECSYRLKLKQGLNFYNESKYSGPYIVINSRMFYIGRRSSFGSFTYSLSKDEREELVEIFKSKGVELHENIKFSLCRNDLTSDNNRACCLVILTIHDKKYNIKNFNIRAMIETTALEIRNYLREKGFMAAIQVIGSKSLIRDTSKIQKSQDIVRKKKDETRINTHKVILEGQISIFDILNNSDWNDKVMQN